MIFHVQAIGGGMMGAFFALAAMERLRKGAFSDDELLILFLCGVGAVMGAFLSTAIRPPRNPNARTLAVRWLASVVATISLAPFIIEQITDRLDLASSPFGTICFATLFSFLSWQILTTIIKSATVENLREIIKRIFRL